jgi:hypothetical protein
MPDHLRSLSRSFSGERPQRGHTQDDSQVEVSNQNACKLEGHCSVKGQRPNHRLVELTEGEGEIRGKLNRNRSGTLETAKQEVPSQRVALESKMDSSFLKEQADRCRSLAENADPFIRRRLLDLAARYDARSSLPSRTPRTFGTPVSLLESWMQGQPDAGA